MGNMNFDFALMTSSVVCVAVCKNVFDWPIVPNMWPVIISTNLSKEEVVAFEDDGSQLQQREALFPCRRFSTIATFSIPGSHFYMPSNLAAHPTFRFGKTMYRNPTTPLGKKSSQTLGKKRKWMSCKHLYYVFSFLCKVDYESDKCIHAPTYTYNEVKRLLELAGVVECE